MKKVIFGTEPYSVDEKIKELTAGLGDMGIARFPALTEEVFHAAEVYPMFTARQVVIVDMDKLGACEELVKAKIPDFTDFIVVPKSVDKRTSSYKALEKAGCIIECPKLDIPSLKKWIIDMVQEQGGSIGNDVLTDFINYIGYEFDENVSLYTVEVAVKKLCLATAQIAMTDVEALVERSVNVKMWELSNILLDQNAPKLYATAQRLLDEKESGIGMLSLLLRTFRLAYKASLYKGMKEADVGKKLGVAAFQYKKATRYAPEQISRSLDLLQSGANKIKSGLPERVVFPLTLGEVLAVLGGA